MITWRYRYPKEVVDGEIVSRYSVGDCLSSDEKPTDGIYNGSKLYEMDTKKTWKFDMNGEAWLDATGSSSGGSAEALTEDEVEEILNAN